MPVEILKLVCGLFAIFCIMYTIKRAAFRLAGILVRNYGCRSFIVLSPTGDCESIESDIYAAKLAQPPFDGIILFAAEASEACSEICRKAASDCGYVYFAPSMEALCEIINKNNK